MNRVSKHRISLAARFDVLQEGTRTIHITKLHFKDVHKRDIKNFGVSSCKQTQQSQQSGECWFSIHSGNSEPHNLNEL